MTRTTTRKLTVVPWIALLLTLAVATASVQAQEDADELAKINAETACARAFVDLVQQLDRPPLLPIAPRMKLLLDFLTLYEASERSPELLRARLRLGSISLQRLDAKTAELAFARIAELAKDADPDLRAKALFGLHQAYVLAGDRDRAREALTTIVRERDGEPAAKTAEVAMAHLDGHTKVELGKPLPELGYGRDLADRLVTSESFAPGPRLLVFWSLAHAPSQNRLEAFARAWRTLGMPPQNLVAYAVDDDIATLHRVATEKAWLFPVVPALGEGFLHADWLKLSITAVPTALLVDVDGRLLANDLPPDRLARMFGN